ncbi:MAG: hypothetical protein ACM3VZ_14235 [Acidobacteriota bacterium]
MPPSCPTRICSLRRASRIPLAGLSALALATLVACGGGGGGGGASSDGGATEPSTVGGVGAGFPLGVTAHSPTALSGTTSAYAQGSSVVTAVAEGSQSLDSTLITVGGLFGSGYLTHAACYGPAVAFSHHDDLPTAADGTLPLGDVAMWTDDDALAPGNPACAVAELDAELGPVTLQVRQGLLLTAALRRLAATSGANTLPDPGTTRDLTAPLAAQLASLLPGVVVQSATLAAQSDASQYTYRLVLLRGSGASAEQLEVVLLHTPNDTDARFAGVLRVTHSHLSTSTDYGCTDVVDGNTGRYRVAHVSTLGYNRYDDALSHRLRSAQYCGGAAIGSTSHFADVATPTESGELDPTFSLDGSGRRNGIKGWKRELLRYSADVNLNALSGDHLQSWQLTPQDGNSRLFLVHDSGAGATHTARVFHAYGSDLSTSDGSLIGMICNWSGPGASHTSVTPAFQSQVLSLSGGRWSRTSSAIHYAPTNICSASASMLFDADGDGALVGLEGSGAGSALDGPSGGRDVQSEAMARGYWPPSLY